MAELMVNVDADAFAEALEEGSKTLNWARENWGLPRRQSDELKDVDTKIVPIPAKIVLNMSSGLKVSPITLTPPGEWRNLALLNADSVGMIELRETSLPHEELIAERTTLEAARRGFQYHKEQWREAMRLRAALSAVEPTQLKRDELKWIQDNLDWLCPPTIVWENAIPDQQVAAAGTILRKIDDEIRSKPTMAYGPRGPNKSMAQLISRSEEAVASTETIAADLTYPKYGFAIFTQTVSRHLTLDLSLVDEEHLQIGNEEDGSPVWEVNETITAHHKFSIPCLHLTHYLIVAPHDAQFVYLTVPPLQAEQEREVLRDEVYYWCNEDHERLAAIEDGLTALNHQAADASK